MRDLWCLTVRSLAIWVVSSAGLCFICVLAWQLAGCVYALPSHAAQPWMTLLREWLCTDYTLGDAFYQTEYDAAESNLSGRHLTEWQLSECNEWTPTLASHTYSLARAALDEATGLPEAVLRSAPRGGLLRYLYIRREVQRRFWARDSDSDSS